MSPPTTSHRVTTPHLSIAYEESGTPTGQPILLLHGFPYSPRQYDRVISLLTKTQPQSHRYRIITPFLRGFTPTTYLSPNTPHSGSQAALAADLIDLLDALNIDNALLVGYDWGGRAACIVSALYPHRVTGLITCQGYAIQDIQRNATSAADPEVTLRRWYTHYFNTPQGVIGLRERRREFCRLLWRMWSPDWRFSGGEFEETAKAWEGEAWVETVVHSYRHRYGNVSEVYEDEDRVEVEDEDGGGEGSLRWIQERCASRPKIEVPTVVVSGGSDGVEPPEGQGRDTQRESFTGFYERRVLEGVGHCPPAEAPEEIVKAIRTLLEL